MAGLDLLQIAGVESSYCGSHEQLKMTDWIYAPSAFAYPSSLAPVSLPPGKEGWIRKNTDFVVRQTEVCSQSDAHPPCHFSEPWFSPLADEGAGSCLGAEPSQIAFPLGKSPPFRVSPQPCSVRNSENEVSTASQPAKQIEPQSPRDGDVNQSGNLWTDRWTRV